MPEKTRLQQLFEIWAQEIDYLPGGQIIRGHYVHVDYEKPPIGLVKQAGIPLSDSAMLIETVLCYLRQTQSGLRHAVLLQTHYGEAHLPTRTRVVNAQRLLKAHKILRENKKLTQNYYYRWLETAHSAAEDILERVENNLLQPLKLTEASPGFYFSTLDVFKKKS